MATKINDENPLYNGFNFWVICIVCVTIFIISIYALNSQSNRLETLGESICNEKGLDFDYYEESDALGYTFYCFDESRNIENGYLKLSK